MFTICQEKNKDFIHQHSANLRGMELSLEERETLRENLRREMLRRGLNQKQFAQLLGFKPQYIGQIFSRKASGSRQIVTFAKRLKVSVEFLLNLEEPAPEATAQFAYRLPPEDLYAEAQAPAPADLDLIAACVEETMKYVYAHRIKYSPQRLGDGVRRLYEHCVLDSEPPTPDLVKAYLRLT